MKHTHTHVRTLRHTYIIQTNSFSAFSRYLIFVPLMGAFLKSLVFLLVVYLDLDMNYLYLAYAVDGFSGSFYALVLGLSASIADVTISSRQRVLLFALLDIVLAMAGAVSHVKSYRTVGVDGWVWVWVGVGSVSLFALLDIMLAVAGAVSHVNSYRAVGVDMCVWRWMWMCGCGWV